MGTRFPAKLGDNERNPMEFGVQLYTVRNVLEKDLFGGLDTLRDIGIQALEFAGFHGHAAAKVKAHLDKNGQYAPSIHTGINWDAADFGLSQVIADAKVLGSKTLVLPWLDSKALDGKWKDIVPKLSAAGKFIQAAGLEFAYHNHDFEFRPDRTGSLPYDTLLTVPEDLMGIELDLYWVAYAGTNPAQQLTNLGSRTRLAHIKDGLLKGPATFTAVGSGDLSWETLVRACRDLGVEYGFIELDSHADPMRAVRESWEYLRQFRDSKPQM